MDKKKVVIVGGGTAGWLTAAFLNTQLPLKLGQAVEITVIEASDIPTIGVGEATIPSLRTTLAACGIEEHIFMTQCDATFKHGIEFINWRQSPETNSEESYFHPFGEPLQVAGHNPAWQWSQLPKEQRGDYAELFSVQPAIARDGRAPKHVKDKPYDGALSYAYHLDAGKLAQFLKKRFRAQGIRHIIDTVEVVTKDGSDITSLTLASGESIDGDLYIDCTGFAARLINSDKANEFTNKSDVLFVDKAVTTRIDHSGISDINGYTKCTAQTAGWIWDIALQERKGIGHVYSSKYISDEAAIAELANYINRPVSDLEVRQLDMRIGYHKQQWRGNCIAVGLSGGFLEPLESTGIYLIEMANWAMIELLPRYFSGANQQGKYDMVMSNHYENIVDFLKLHYCLTERRDTKFWADNCDPNTIPETLRSNLDNWKTAVPGAYDFDRSIQCFSANNYQFVLYGMSWKGHELPNSSKTNLNMVSELSRRRERLLSYVRRDTVSNSEYFLALQKLQT